MEAHSDNLKLAKAHVYPYRIRAWMEAHSDNLSWAWMEAHADSLLNLAKAHTYVQVRVSTLKILVIPKLSSLFIDQSQHIISCHPGPGS